MNIQETIETRLWCWYRH